MLPDIFGSVIGMALEDGSRKLTGQDLQLRIFQFMDQVPAALFVSIFTYVAIVACAMLTGMSIFLAIKISQVINHE